MTPHVTRNHVERRRQRTVLAAAMKHRCATLAELRRAPEVSLYRRDVLDATIDQLVADGRLVDAPGPGEPLVVLTEGLL